MRTGDVVVVLPPTVRYQGTRSMAPISQVILAQMICAARRAPAASEQCPVWSAARVGTQGWPAKQTAQAAVPPSQHMLRCGMLMAW